ncbi:MAG: PAS domain S-box protein [Syntrophaceae bacterium]|nr:PAS domain S-box protein [Syntrophaceae bacterium]
MPYIDLILNLALLVALSVFSGFIDKRWPRNTFTGVLMQGFLFGTVTILGMLRPLVMGHLIFDGRSIIISLCALFFGHQVTAITAGMAAAYRLSLGGPGVVMGVSVILVSAVLGLLARHYIKPNLQPPSTLRLFFLGLAVHTAMLSLMFTLPGKLAMATIKSLGLPVITLYPLATILAGKILSDQLAGLINAKALQESEERYRKLFEDHAAVKLLVDPATADIIDANKAAEQYYGWPREKLKQMKVTDINTLSPEEIKKEMEKANTKKKIYFEFRHRLANGSIRDVDVFSSKVEVRGRDLLHSIVHDVTERRQAEEALRIKNLAFDTSIAANSIADAEGIIIEANYSFITLWGYKNKEEIVGNPISYFFKNTDEASAIVTSLNRNGHWQGNFTAKKKDGSTFICYSMATIIRDKNGNITGYQSSVSDITEQMQSQEELKRLTQELEKRVNERTEELHKSQLALLNVVDDLNENAKLLSAANESLAAINRELEAFAYSVSHDLRAPLRSIDGFSAALLEDYSNKLDETGKNYLERVRRATQLMGELIDDMLKLSRVNKADFQPEPVNLSEIAKEITESRKKHTGGKTVKIKIEKNIMTKGDKALLQIALTNLIDNAFKFSSKQNNPSIEFGSKQKDGKEMFYLRDNGTGFDMTYANKLFTPFQRLHTQDEFSGTGIGLATVQRIIHRHGGQIWAESEAGKGATFFFTLP